MPVTGPATPAKGPRQPLELAPERAIQEQLVRDLYERSRVAIVTMLVLLGVLRWAIDPAYQVDARARVLFDALIAISLARLAITVIPPRRRDARATVRTQFVFFTGGVALSSITLGALVTQIWPLLDPARISIVAVLVSGLVSGAVMSLGFSPIVYMFYMTPPMGALFLMAVTDHRPAWGADILATSFALFGMFVFAISLDQRRARRQAIELGLQLSDLVVRDTLTQLHNRRFLEELMAIEEARLARAATDVEQGRQPERDSVMGVYVMDLDFFKQVNDLHGHAAGDAVLKQAAAVLSATLRRSDNLVRWGGEEFVAVAWVQDSDHPRFVAEKLRSAVEKAVFTLPNGQTLRKTISMGFCLLPFFSGQPRRLTWEQVLDLADAALFVAKAEGRNRWVGVNPGALAWSDTQETCVDILHDLRRASERGLVTLDRLRPAEATPSVPG